MATDFVLHSRLHTSTLLKGYGWFHFYLSTGLVKLAEKLVSGANGLTATCAVLPTSWAWGPRWRQATQPL